jgi:hypothetical protein
VLGYRIERVRALTGGVAAQAFRLVSEPQPAGPRQGRPPKRRSRVGARPTSSGPRRER